MTRADIAEVMAKVPGLHIDGIGLSRSLLRKSPEQRRARELELEEELLNSADLCTKVCGWLEGKGKRRTVNRRHTSYSYKHLAEADLKVHVPNGAFIAAAIHSGFAYRIEPGSPNVLFNISERSLGKVRRV